jgi:DNA-binding CsgD family transcriptional regulator
MTNECLEARLRDIADATNPNLAISIADRRRKVTSAICQLIESDVWLWFTGVIDPEANGDSMVTTFVDGGFSSDQERADFFRIIIHPELAPIATKPLAEALRSQRTITCRRQELVSDHTWDLSPVSVIWNQLGFDDFIISAFPVGTNGYSALGFHRRINRPRFEETDSLIVSAMSHSLTWLHFAVSPPQASEVALQLSPRERQVLMMLLGGDSRKQVANKLGISEHTVTDYLKAIYSKFSVNSRAELLSKFVSSETNTP